jgi:hypothetical protein
MGYTRTKVLNPDATFGSIMGAVELDEMDENSGFKELPSGITSRKGFKIKEFGGKKGVTRLMADWLTTNKSLMGADSSVQQAYSEFKDQYRSLTKGAIKSENFEATGVLTNGWSMSNAFGPGSATANGVSVFSDSHIYKPGLVGSEKNFRNTLGGGYGTEDDELSTTSLQHMINLHKSELRHYNGDRVMIPDEYLLVTGRRLSSTAQSVLNTNTQQAGKYSGVGSNAMQINSFTFDMNKVGFLSHPVIGATDKNDNLIGTDSMYFLLNTAGISESKALREFYLNNGEVRMWFDENANKFFVSYYKSCAFDHYGLESYITGSRGTA